MNKKISFLIVLILVAVAAIVFSKKKGSESAAAAVEDITSDGAQNEVTVSTPASTDTTAKITAASSTLTTTSAAPASGDDEPQTEISFSDFSGKEVSRINLTERRVSDAVQVIEKNNGLNPAVEFAGLKDPDFTKEESSMFSGLFQDSATKTELRITFAIEKNLMNPHSCFYSPATGEVYGDDGLAFKDDGAGYGMLYIKNNTYARIKWAFGDRRTIVGRLFKSDGSVQNFAMTEVQPRANDKLNFCYKSKWQQAYKAPAGK